MPTGTSTTDAPEAVEIDTGAAAFDVRGNEEAVAESSTLVAMTCCELGIHCLDSTLVCDAVFPPNEVGAGEIEDADAITTNGDCRRAVRLCKTLGVSGFSLCP